MATAKHQDTSASGVDAAKIEEWKSKYGDVLNIKSRFGQMVFRTPARGDYNRFSEAALDATGKVNKRAAMEDLVRSSLLYPSVEVFDGILDKKPGYLSAITNALRELAGGDELEINIEGN